MDRSVAVVGARSSIGIRPYEDGVARQLGTTAAVLRERGLITRLHATDMGDVVAPPYRDYVRPPGRPRNETEVVMYSRALAKRVATATRDGHFCLVLGGDCSVVLGCLLGARQVIGTVGLCYVDAHADFATPEESRTGSVASMSLGLAVGRGDTPLARLAGRSPLVNRRHVALVGRRDAAEPWYGHAALAASRILDLPDAESPDDRVEDVTAASLACIAADEVDGFWIQVDADVLNPAVMWAVDSPEPGGPMPHELAALLLPLVSHPRALGMSVTIYDPALDPDRSCARQLISLLESRLISARRVD